MSEIEALSEKTLVMLVGPSAIGKSTIMNEMARLHDDFAYVRAFTSRAPRVGEQSHYRFINPTEAASLYETEQTITYLEHPTTGDIYGTTAESFPATYNLLDTLSSSVNEYRNLPFNKTVTLAVTAQADQWKKWFLTRYPQPSAEAEKRLAEAALSINWALADNEAYWLSNRDNAIQELAKKAIEISLNPPSERITPNDPYAMLELIEKGMWNVENHNF